MFLKRYVNNLEEIILDNSRFRDFFTKEFKDVPLLEFNKSVSHEDLMKHAVAGLVMQVNEPYYSNNGYQCCVTLEHVPALGHKGPPMLLTVQQLFFEYLVNLRSSDLIIIQNFTVDNLVSSCVGKSKEYVFYTKSEPESTIFTVYRSQEFQEHKKSKFFKNQVNYPKNEPTISPSDDLLHIITDLHNSIEKDSSMSSGDLLVENISDHAQSHNEETKDSFESIIASIDRFYQDEIFNHPNTVNITPSKNIFEESYNKEEFKFEKSKYRKRKFSAINDENKDLVNQKKSVSVSIQKSGRTGSKLSFTKLADLKAETKVSVYGLVVFCQQPKFTAINQHYLQLAIRDETLEPKKLIFAHFYSQEKAGLPLDCLGTCLVITDADCASYRTTKQILAKQYSKWWMIQNCNGSIQISRGNASVKPNFDISPMVNLYQEHYAQKTSSKLKKIKFSEITEDLHEFSANVLILGVFYSQGEKNNVLIVTDGTKCPLDTSHGIILSEALYSFASYPLLEKFSERLSYIKFEGPILSNACTLSPLKFVQLNISIYRNNELLSLRISSNDKPYSIISLYNEGDAVIELKEHLGFEDAFSDPCSWRAVSLPGLNIKNSFKVKKEPFVEPENELIVEPKEEPTYKIQFSGDLPCIKEVNFSYLLNNSTSSLFIYKLKARIVAIWPDSFSKGLLVNCSICENKTEYCQLNTLSNGNLFCTSCKKQSQIKIRFLILLYDDITYIPVVLVQENALKFFKLNYKLEELTNEICQETDLVHSRFFNKLSGSNICEISENWYTVFIQAVKIVNFDNQRDLLVYELCGTVLEN